MGRELLEDVDNDEDVGELWSIEVTDVRLVRLASSPAAVTTVFVFVLCPSESLVLSGTPPPVVMTSLSPSP